MPLHTANKIQSPPNQACSLPWIIKAITVKMSPCSCLLKKSNIPRRQNRVVGSHKSALSPVQRRAGLAHALPEFKSSWDTVKRKRLFNKNKCELQSSWAEISTSVIIALKPAKLGSEQALVIQGGSLFFSCCQVFLSSSRLLLFPFSCSLNTFFWSPAPTPWIPASLLILSLSYLLPSLHLKSL